MVPVRTAGPAEAAARVRRGRRPGPAGPVLPPAYPHPAPARRRRRRLRRSRSTAAATRADVDGATGDRHAGPRTGPHAASSSATGSASSATPPATPGALARIVRIDERTSVLRRTADDDDTTVEGRQERVVVANADQLVIVCALADPPPRTGFIDRCLVAAYDAEIEPLLCLTKADLAGAGRGARLLRRAGPAARAVPARPALDRRCAAALAGRVSVLVGHSGVGKSTLVNRLVPDADRAVGVVSAIGKGRHTSTSAVALRLPARQARGSGWIVDTPGRPQLRHRPRRPRTTCCTASPSWSRRRPTARPTATTPALRCARGDRDASRRGRADCRGCAWTRWVAAGSTPTSGGSAAVPAAARPPGDVRRAGSLSRSA